MPTSEHTNKTIQLVVLLASILGAGFWMAPSVVATKGDVDKLNGRVETTIDRIDNRLERIEDILIRDHARGKRVRNTAK